MKRITTYILTYYLKNQSELFSRPQVFEAGLEEMKKAVAIAKQNGYKIVKLERI